VGTGSGPGSVAVAVLAPLTRSAGEYGPSSPGALSKGTVMIVTGLAFAAATWGVLMGLSPVLQIRRMIRQRSSRDVSIGYFAVLLIGFVLWISYGIAARNPALIVPNAVALLVVMSTIAVALRLGHGPSSER
jgi:MtN3 and saliva related transmembrane protein